MTNPKEVASLTGALLARKGSAAPADIVGRPFGTLSLVRGGPSLAPVGSPPSRPRPPVQSFSRYAPERIKLSIRFDQSRHLKIKLAAAHLRLSVQDLLTTAVDSYLERIAPEVLGGSCACLSQTAGTQPEAAEGAATDRVAAPQPD